MFSFKTIRIIIYINAVLALIIVTITLIFNVYLTNRLKNEVVKISKSKYQLTLDRLSINYLTKSITIYNCVISPNYTSTINTSYGILNCKAITISNISVSALILNQQLKIDSLSILKPDVSLFIDTAHRYNKLDELIVSKVANDESESSPKLQSVSINQFHLTNLNLIIYKGLKKSNPTFSTNENFINCKQLIINLNDSTVLKKIHVNTLELTINNFRYQLATDSLYTIKSKRVYANYNTSQLQFDSLQLKPNYSKKEFSKKANKQISRAKISTSSVLFDNINYDSLIYKQKLSIHKITVKDCDIDVFRDNNFFLAPIEKPTVQQLIKKIPFLISIDSVTMNQGVLTFEAKHPHACNTGKIAVNDMNVIVTNVNNDSAAYSENQCIQVHADGRILNKGKFIENYIFPLNNDSNLFYCSGSLSSMPLFYFNSLIKPVKHLSFRTGQLDAISFSFVASNRSSYGKMKFTYHNLKIDLLNKYNQKGGFVKGIKTIIANNLLLYNSNPQNHSLTRVSRIYYKNNKYRYFINYAMQSILSGIEPSILINKKQ